MKYECPNCKQFAYEKGWSNLGCGFILLLGLPIFIGMIPGASGFYGGTVDMGFFVYIIPLSIIIGWIQPPQLEQLPCVVPSLVGLA